MLYGRVGALDFRDFSGSPGEKENRIGIARTLPPYPKPKSKGFNGY